MDSISIKTALILFILFFTIPIGVLHGVGEAKDPLRERGPAFTVSGIPTETELKAGTTQTLMLTVNSTYNGTESLHFQVEPLLYAEVNLTRTTLEIGAYASVLVVMHISARVNIPANASEYLNYSVSGKYTAYIYNGSCHIQYVANAVFRPNVLEEVGYVAPNQSAGFHLVVTNIGNKAGSFTVTTAQSNPWILVVENESTVNIWSLDPDDNLVLYLSIHNSTPRPAGREVVDVVITDTEDGEIYTTILNVSVTAFHSMAMSLKETTMYAYESTPTYLSIVLENSGNTYLDLALDITFPKERLTLSEVYVYSGGDGGIEVSRSPVINITSINGTLYLERSGHYSLELPPFTKVIFGIYLTPCLGAEGKVNVTLIARANDTGVMFFGPREVEKVIPLTLLRYNLTIIGPQISPQVPRASEFATVKIDLINHGSADVNGLRVVLSDNGFPMDSQDIGRVVSGGSVSVIFTLSFRIGTHALTIQIKPLKNTSLNITGASIDFKVKGNVTDTNGSGNFFISLAQATAIVVILILLIVLYRIVHNIKAKAMKAKRMRNIGKIANRYRQRGEVPEELKAPPEEYDGGVHVRRLVLPEIDKDKPWTHCLNCGANIEYPEYICPECGANMREYYENLTKPRCVWCDTELDESWMDIIERCDGFVAEGEVCTSGPFCSRQCLEDHKRMAPHYHPLKDED